MGAAGEVERGPHFADDFFSRGVSVPPFVVETPQALKEFVGREIATTEWFTVTQERIVRFAEATEDRQWIHVDPECACKESPYGSTVAHGFLTLSLLSHFLAKAIRIRSGVRMSINYGLNRVRFPAAVRAGKKIRARVTLQSQREDSVFVEAVFNIAVECERETKPCCAAEWIIRYYL
jgi:acyl dehydratase